jgi:hypothetical protein
MVQYVYVGCAGIFHQREREAKPIAMPGEGRAAACTKFNGFDGRNLHLRGRTANIRPRTLATPRARALWNFAASRVEYGVPRTLFAETLFSLST